MKLLRTLILLACLCPLAATAMEMPEPKVIQLTQEDKDKPATIASLMDIAIKNIIAQFTSKETRATDLVALIKKIKALPEDIQAHFHHFIFNNEAPLLEEINNSEAKKVCSNLDIMPQLELFKNYLVMMSYFERKIRFLDLETDRLTLVDEPENDARDILFCEELPCKRYVLVRSPLHQVTQKVFLLDLETKEYIKLHEGGHYHLGHLSRVTDTSFIFKQNYH